MSKNLTNNRNKIKSNNKFTHKLRTRACMCACVHGCVCVCVRERRKIELTVWGKKVPIALDGIRTCISGIRAHTASDCTTTAGTPPVSRNKHFRHSPVSSIVKQSCMKHCGFRGKHACVLVCVGQEVPNPFCLSVFCLSVCLSLSLFHSLSLSFTISLSLSLSLSSLHLSLSQ